MEDRSTNGGRTVYPLFAVQIGGGGGTDAGSCILRRLLSHPRSSAFICGSNHPPARAGMK